MYIDLNLLIWRVINSTLITQELNNTVPNYSTHAHRTQRPTSGAFDIVLHGQPANLWYFVCCIGRFLYLHRCFTIAFHWGSSMPASCKSWFPVTILCLHWGVSRDLHCINHAFQQVVIFPIIILCLLPRLQISSRRSCRVFVRCARILKTIIRNTPRSSSSVYIRAIATTHHSCT